MDDECDFTWSKRAENRRWIWFCAMITIEQSVCPCLIRVSIVTALYNTGALLGYFVLLCHTPKSSFFSESIHHTLKVSKLSIIMARVRRKVLRLSPHTLFVPLLSRSELGQQMCWSFIDLTRSEIMRSVQLSYLSQLLKIDYKYAHFLYTGSLSTPS